MRLILQRNFAIAKKSREKLRRQNLFTKLVASLNKHGSIKSDISDDCGRDSGNDSDEAYGGRKC